MITRLPSCSRARMPHQFSRPILQMFNFVSRSFKSQATANGECIEEEDCIMNASHIQQFMEERGFISISKDVTVTPPHSDLDDACEVKCLVFMVSNNPLLVILRLHDRVSEKSLADHLSISKSRLTMAPPSELIRLTGYPVGSIPPFGHKAPLYTIVDHSVVTHTHVVFGDDREYCLPTTELLRAARAVVAHVSTSAVAALTDDDDSSSSGSSSSIDGDNEGKQALILPLPWGAGAQAVTLTAIIAQKRKIAGLLVFLTVVPPFPTPGASKTTNALWRHPDNNTTNGEPAEVQLILGKTLERRLGRVAAAELFKKLKPGDMIRVTGRPQPHVPSAAAGLRSSDHHVVVDMVVHDVEMIKEGVAIRNTRNTAAVDIDSGEDVSAVQAERGGSDSDNDEYDDDEESDEEEEKKRRKAELNALSPATIAALEADMPVYELSVALENVIVVDCLEKIEVMRSLLFAHHQHHHHLEEREEDGGGAVAQEILKETTRIEKKSSYLSSSATPLMTARARARAARREAETTPGTWRPAVVVGMDAEWRPITREDSKTPVSVLQIGSSTHVFLIDMLALCTTSNALVDYSPSSNTVNESSTSAEELSLKFELTEEERQLSDFLEEFFADKDIVKVGFGLRYDFKRLVESYRLPCFGYTALATPPPPSSSLSPSTTTTTPPDSSMPFFGRVSIPLASHVDALVLARCAGDGKTAYKRLGLAAITRLVLGRALDKQQQTSDWGARPLTQQQQLYAAADVTCLVDIFNAITATRPEFLSPFWMAQLHSNLVELPQWQLRPPTGGRRSSRSAAENAASGAALPWQAQVTGKRGAGATSQLACNAAALLHYLGGPVPDGGKLSVIRVAASETLPDGSIIEPARMPRSPRGSGVLEFQHRHFLLFVNVPSQRYPNEFSIVETTGGDGADTGEDCFMTWWPGKGHTLSHPLVRRLLPAAAAAEAAKTAENDDDDYVEIELIVKDPATTSNDDDDDSIAPTVLLFVRPQRDGYVCCGRLEAATVSEMDGQLCVSWKLLDFGEIKESTYFRKVLLLQPGTQRS